MYEVKTKSGNYEVPTDHLVNEGGWFGQMWLVGIGLGFSCSLFLVEAGCEQSAIDELVDSEFGHLLIVPPEDIDDIPEDHRSYGGNEGLVVDLDDVRILEEVVK